MVYIGSIIFHAESLPPTVKGFFLFFITGGVLGTQSWSFRISRRVMRPYRPAFGRQQARDDIDDISCANNGAATGREKAQ
jgi:hypothetical protein